MMLLNVNVPWSVWNRPWNKLKKSSENNYKMDLLAIFVERIVELSKTINFYF